MDFKNMNLLKRQVRAFANDGLIEKGEKLFCSICNKRVSTFRSTILNHLKSKLHMRNLAKANCPIETQTQFGSGVEFSIPIIKNEDVTSFKRPINIHQNYKSNFPITSQVENGYLNCLICGSPNSVVLWGDELDFCHSFCLLFSLNENNYLNELQEAAYCQMCIQFIQSNSPIIEQFRKLENEIHSIQNKVKSLFQARQKSILSPRDLRKNLIDNLCKDLDLSVNSRQAEIVKEFQSIQNPKIISQNLINDETENEANEVYGSLITISENENTKVKVEILDNENDSSGEDRCPQSPQFASCDSDTDYELSRSKHEESKRNEDPEFQPQLPNHWKRKRTRIESTMYTHNLIRLYVKDGFILKDGELHCSFCSKCFQTHVGALKSTIEKHINSKKHQINSNAEEQILNFSTVDSWGIGKEFPTNLTKYQMDQISRRAEAFAENGVVEKDSQLFCSVCDLALNYKKSTIQEHIVSENHTRNVHILNLSKVDLMNYDEINLSITENVLQAPLKDLEFHKRSKSKLPWELKHLTESQINYLKQDALKRNSFIPLTKIEELTPQQLTEAMNSEPKRKFHRTTLEFRSLGVKRPQPIKVLKRGAKNFRCPYENCFYSAKTELSLNGHINWKHKKVKGSPHICPTCSQTFKTMSSLQIHVEVQHLGNSYSCEVCGNSYKSTFHLNLHKKRYHSEKKREKELCTICGKSYRFLELHKLEHWEEGDGNFPCDVCSATYKNSKLLQFHKQRLHAAPGSELVNCENKDCDMKFINLYHMRMHSRKVHKEKKYACPQCNEKFSVPSVLQKHITIRHEEFKRFGCDYPECEKRFKFKYDLKVHRNVVHSTEMPFICHICSMPFKTKSHLRRHLTCHSDERPFICEICGDSFKNKGYLVFHMKGVHEGLYKPNKNPVKRRSTKNFADKPSPFILH